MPATQRKPLTTYQGVVAGKSGNQTVRVVLNYLQKHPKYGKILKRNTMAHVHDEKNEAGVGDTVEIAKCRPMSKTKTWRLVRVVIQKVAAPELA
jgi:small subunit ribosomal protein S17